MKCCGVDLVTRFCPQCGKRSRVLPAGSLKDSELRLVLMVLSENLSEVSPTELKIMLLAARIADQNGFFEFDPEVIADKIGHTSNQHAYTRMVKLCQRGWVERVVEKRRGTAAMYRLRLIDCAV